MKYGLLFLLLFLGAGVLQAQVASEKKRNAKELFRHQRYEEAVAVLNSSRQLVQEDKEARFLLALCHYQLNDLGSSLRLLNELVSLDKSPYPECWLFLGRIYHARHEFKKAIDYYKDYLKLLPADAENRRLVWDDIRRCANGLETRYRQADAFVENLGNQVNTRYDEFAPVLSPNFNERLYFSSAREGSIGGLRSDYGAPDNRLGHYFSDIYSCRLQNGVWSDVQALHYLLNSPQHEVLLSFSGNGSVLYYFKGMRPDQGDILVDTFRQAEERILSSTPLLSPVSAAAGDRDLYLYNDTLLFFASRRPGGYGGYDIYRSAWRHNYWTAPENMGPAINTPYDEITPFLSRNGRMLYFSSNRSDLSIGGFDILKSRYNYKTHQWMPSENLGIPINSSGDDTHLRLARDGFTAFFASARKDGLGQRDLYVAYFSDFLEEQEMPAVTYQPPTGASPYEEAVLDPGPGQRMDAPRSGVAPMISPLLLSDGAFSLDEGQRRNLDPLAEALLRNPSLRLVLTGHCGGRQSTGQCFRQAMDAVEQAARYLTARGVSEEALFLRTLGRPWGDGSGPPVMISFHFAGKGDELPGLLTPLQALPSFPTDQPTQEPLCYKVQVAASRRNDHYLPEMDRFDFPMVEKSLGSDFYYFTVGGVRTYAAAEQLRRQAEEAGWENAFVVPYLQQLRLERRQVADFLEAFPDLTNYYYRKVWD